MQSRLTRKASLRAYATMIRGNQHRETKASERTCTTGQGKARGQKGQAAARNCSMSSWSSYDKKLSKQKGKSINKIAWPH